VPELPAVIAVASPRLLGLSNNPPRRDSGHVDDPLYAQSLA